MARCCASTAASPDLEGILSQVILLTGASGGFGAMSARALADAGRNAARVDVHVDPSDDGCEVVNAVADRVRAEFLRRVHLDDLLSTALPAA
jgi:NAD(P)-dependent dehydrogenase (short-subunit alcohol dehydrogenase family)